MMVGGGWWLVGALERWSVDIYLLLPTHYFLLPTHYFLLKKTKLALLNRISSSTM